MNTEAIEKRQELLVEVKHLAEQLHLANIDQANTEARANDLEAENARLKRIEVAANKVNALAQPTIAHGIKFYVTHHKEFLALRKALETDDAD